MYDIYELNEKSLVELKEIALQLGVENIGLPKEELVYCIIDQQAVHPDIIKEKKQEAANVMPETEVTEKPRTKNSNSTDNNRIEGIDFSQWQNVYSELVKQNPSFLNSMLIF